MAMTTRNLGDVLEEYGFEFEKEGEYFWSWRQEPKVYRNADGQHSVYIVVVLTDGGEFIRFLAPKLYNLSGCENRASAMEAALAVGYRTKSLNYEYDPNDGELRAAIEFPLATGTLSPRQIHRCLALLLELIDAGDPLIQHAMRTGEFDWSRFATVPPDPTKQEIAELVEKAGGIDALRKLAERNKAENA